MGSRLLPLILVNEAWLDRTRLHPCDLQLQWLLAAGRPYSYVHPVPQRLALVDDKRHDCRGLHPA
jgi:hypothetical protein